MHETELYDWLNGEGYDTYNVDAGTIVFDQAYVLWVILTPETSFFSSLAT